MKIPLLTMHTNDARDRLWITCDCGWSEAASDFASPEEGSKVAERLAENGRKHYEAAHSGDRL